MDTRKEIAQRIHKALSNAEAVYDAVIRDFMALRLDEVEIGEFGNDGWELRFSGPYVYIISPTGTMTLSGEELARLVSIAANYDGAELQFRNGNLFIRVTD